MIGVGCEVKKLEEVASIKLVDKVTVVSDCEVCDELSSGGSTEEGAED